MNSSSPLSRRAALSLGGATVLGVTTVGLAACSTGAGGGNAAANGPEFPKNTTVASLSDIPVGGTLSATVEGKPLLLAQPTEGKVVCFSAICTHQGCTVDAAAKDFECPCHGSTYAAATGAVTNGPAVHPLAKVKVTVSGGSVVTA
ncbi:Rieske (2Fe-2S) protein [Parafrigoribacterium humi]|jgi:Rieske Fe-S protein|uniref:Rieske (2Fe-2S) protein n=1 Tax=Parafrigoribacterium humi TaxID=3144664 RepID=UPI0032EB237D